ncbi:MAG: hypothetical protein KGH63_00685 [Candidatus Micrarchaeota archaeon]|nr:hypothetical protein [Candidatus Micrarchaeota archaeon]
MAEGPQTLLPPEPNDNARLQFAVQVMAAMRHAREQGQGFERVQELYIQAWNALFEPKQIAGEKREDYAQRLRAAGRLRASAVGDELCQMLGDCFKLERKAYAAAQSAQEASTRQESYSKHLQASRQHSGADQAAVLRALGRLNPGK